MGVARTLKNSSPSDGAFNFGGLTAEMIPDGPPRFSVLPVPYDLTASYMSGMRNGPRAIIEASTHMELYDDELGCEPYLTGIETLAPLEPTALGPREMIKKVRLKAAEMLGSGRIPVMLGGEHSITLGLVEALLKRYPNLSVLQLDAHADMRDEYQETPFNHACVARRISELCPIVQVGIRSLSVEEADFLKDAPRGRLKTFYADAVMAQGASKAAQAAAKALTEDVFITVDLDVFDPSIMPATGTPEPGGLLWRDALDVLRTVASKKRVVGFDVVELCPMPGNVAPDFMAAKLVYKLMGYINARIDRPKARGRQGGIPPLFKGGVRGG